MSFDILATMAKNTEYRIEMNDMESLADIFQDMENEWEVVLSLLPYDSD